MGELFTPLHLFVLAMVFVVLFGANKLPQMARSVGQSMRIFKAETRAMSGEKPEPLPPHADTPPPTDGTEAHQQRQPPAG